MKDVRLGLVGAGGIAQSHCRSIAQIEGAQIAAVSDVVRANAESTAETWAIADVYDNYQDMLDRDDLDGVVVCTPTAVHGAPSVAALKAGKHVLCEKPMEASLEAATAMVRAAHESGRMLMVALKLRFTPEVQRAKAIMDSGVLGRVYYAETVADRRRGAPAGSFIRKDTAGFGAAADIGVYALDTALHLLGHPKPVAVSGMTSNELTRKAHWNPDLQKTEVEDFATAWVLFENGVRLVFKTCWCMNMDSLGGTFILGTEAGLRIGIGEVRGPEEGVAVYRDDEDGEPGVFPETVGEQVDVFLAENQAFVDAVRSGGPSPIDPDGMLLTNVIIQGVVDSEAAGGREVAVTVPTLA